MQITSPGDGTLFRDPAAIGSVAFRRTGHGGRAPTFDLAEQQELSKLGAAVREAMAAASNLPPAAGQPVRVGGNIKVPTKIHDVRPVYPEAALAARVTGVVVLEALINLDGGVRDVRVLRGIPALDAAAAEAVRQWRFEPTYLNGVAVPVIMTVTVSFNLQ